MVMLDLDQGDSQRASEAAADGTAVVVGMQVHRDGLRAMLKQIAVEHERALEFAQGRGLVEVAKMLGEDQARCVEQAEGIFQLAAECQHRGGAREAVWSEQRRRRMAARAAQQARMAGIDARQRVIEAIDDVSIMQQ